MRRGGTIGVMGSLLVSALVCGGGCSPSSVNFEDQLRQLLGTPAGTLNPDTLNIRIVNEAGSNVNVELTVSVDGVDQTFTCTSDRHVCDNALAVCPQTVETISSRLTDTNGYFQGGTNFNGSSDVFNFDSSKFTCGQIIIYQFTGNSVDAFVL